MYVLGLAYEISPWFCTETHPNLNVKTPFPPGEGVCVCASYQFEHCKIQRERHGHNLAMKGHT